MNALLFLGGLILLVVGASALVRDASKLAMSFGISPLAVGLTIVALGTSAPEVAVSVGAVLDGKTDIAIGNECLVHEALAPSACARSSAAGFPAAQARGLRARQENQFGTTRQISPSSLAV